MAPGHPTDRLGRVLPDSAWPADRAAPEHLDLIRRFFNTCNRESGADRFETADGMSEWLVDQNVSHAPASEADRARIVAFREHLRDHARSHHDRTPDHSLTEALVEHIAGIELGFSAREDQGRAVPAAVGIVNETIGTVSLAVAEAQRQDCWTRFKACPGCGWVFYDRSKNRSGRWCSMRACGGRAKVAAFRARSRTRRS